jgi:hypothetical protein
MSFGSRPRRILFASGAGLGLAVLLGVADFYLRFFPGKDIYPYLGASSPAIDIWRRDPDFGVSYRSWEAFCQANRQALDPYLPFAKDPRPIWAFFGNSFIHMQGMLADTARRHVHDHIIFNLGRNEELPVRLAQIKLLLDHGLKPERLFIELMPVDLLPLGKQPLDTYVITDRGALTYRPRWPPAIFGDWVRSGGLPQALWFRTNRHIGNPRFRPDLLYSTIDPILRSDVHRLFANLARIAAEHQVPVTILLIPSYHQVVRRAPFGFQDIITADLRPLGFDIFDPRAAFRTAADPAGLYLADLHLSPPGNELLLQELLEHLQATNPMARLAGPTP